MLGWREALEQVIFVPTNQVISGIGGGFLSSYYCSLLFLISIWIFILSPSRFSFSNFKEKLKEEKFRKKYALYFYIKVTIFMLLAILGFLGYLIVVENLFGWWK